jgi:YVTN family beta-propeller protein
MVLNVPAFGQQPQALPNMGQQITPLAPYGSRFAPLNPGLPYDPALLAGQGWLASNAVTTVVSPDQKTLLVLTSGFNRINNTNTVVPAGVDSWYGPASTEYVFIYDISTPVPVQKQAVQIPNTYNGIVWDPTGLAFYVAGGPSDDIHVVTRNDKHLWVDQPTLRLPLGHGAGVGLNVLPCAAGVAIAKDGQTLVVVNYFNDSITIFRGGLGNWTKWRDLDLRPGWNDPSQTGVPGGTYPFWVALKGTGTGAVAYISSVRDREIVVAKLSGPPELMNPAGRPSVVTRIHVRGQPNKMTLNAAQTLLYVVEDQSDTVEVIDTATNAIVETIPVIAPPSLLPMALAAFTGANPDSVALSPDEKQLYVTNGNLNSIAVVALGGANKDDQVIGLIPTGWYPNSVSFSGDGATVYVVNGKSPTGPNPGWCYGGYGPVGSPTCLETNQYSPQLTKAGFQSFPRPAANQLATLTAQVAVNNHFSSTVSAADAATMAAVRQGVQHVIFVIKENRTYDQILGDLEKGNGDPSLTEFGEIVTPNQHMLAMNFVTLDNFMDTAEISYDGWLWTTAARAPDVVERQMPVAYASRGTSLDGGGTNRNVNVAIPTQAARMDANPNTPADPNVLAGGTDITAPDGPGNEVNTGYLWDAAFRANLTVRNYGFFIDGARYGSTAFAIPVERYPFNIQKVVAFAASASLAPFTDPYFRGFDNALPDFYRYKEWEREFDTNYVKGGLPSLSLVRFMHDHTGSYDTAIDGVNVPELQVADNDYAVGMLIEKISKSIYANNTLVFVVEDDAQDGGDHVDAHRSTAFVAGAWVKQGELVSTQYSTLDYLRTIEEVLGLPPMNLNDALARPMADIFTTAPLSWSFTAKVPALLYGTSLPLGPKPPGLIVPKTQHNAKYWAKATKGMDFDAEDLVDPHDFNHLLWKGLMGKRPYPATPTGLDLRLNREALLEAYRRSLK